MVGTDLLSRERWDRTTSLLAAVLLVVSGIPIIASNPPLALADHGADPIDPPIACSSTDMVGLDANQLVRVNKVTGATTTFFTTSVGTANNGVASNTDQGFIYWGSGQIVYYYDTFTGTEGVLADFTGQLNGTLESGGGTYFDGYYYFGVEDPTFAEGTEGLYRVQIDSTDGSSIVPGSLQLLAADQPDDGLDAAFGNVIPDYGDIAATTNGLGQVVLYGSTNDLNSNFGDFWSYNVATGAFTSITSYSNNQRFQLGFDLSGTLYGTLDNGEIYIIDTATGGTTLVANSGRLFFDLAGPYCEIPKVAGINLDKSSALTNDADGSGDVSLGDTITYTFVATNTGNVDLNNVSIADPLPGLSALSCSPAAGSTIAPQATMTCTATYVVTQSDVDGGTIDNTATATGTSSEDGSTVNDTADDSVPITQVSAISVVKSLTTDPAGATVGTIFDYEFVVTNEGNVTLTSVGVTDPLIASISCPQTTLDPDESMTCTGSYSVTQADLDAGVINNVATAEGTDPNSTVVDDTDNEQALLEQTPSVGLDKNLDSNADEDGSGDVTLGDTLTYEFVATNTGNVTLLNVEITDPFPGLSVLSCTPTQPATLAPGETLTCTATYMVTQADVDAGNITNTATVNGTTAGGTDVDDQDTRIVPVAQSPSILGTKSFTAITNDVAPLAEVSLGDEIQYTFTMTNDGTVTLFNATITDPLPGLSALDCSPDTLPTTLAPGDGVTCTATYTITQADVDAGRVDNTATFTAETPQGDPVDDTDNETVLPTSNPDISLLKSLASNADEDGSGSVSLGDTLTYEFLVTNEGDVTLDTVGVTDPLPGMSAISCPATQLAPGASTTCTGTYVVTQADVDAGQIFNTATASGTDVSDGVVVTDDDDETVPITTNPSVDLVKSLQSNADEDGSADVSVGDTLTYSFVAANEGDVTLSSVTITDPLPGMSALTCAPTQPATLAPGATMTCTATYTVTQADVDAGLITNTATVVGTPPGGGTVSDTSTENVVPPQNPSIALTKGLQGNADEDGSGTITAGDTLTYEFVATNDGDVTLDLVTITDPLPGLSTLSCTPAAGASLAPGASMTCTATYSVTQADVDSGEIFNTATVRSERPGGDPGDPGDDITDTADETVTIPAAPVITLVKSIASTVDNDGSGTLTTGDTVNYEFLVTNEGNVTLNPVSVSDPKIGTVTCPATSLAPGEATTCTGSYTVTVGDAAAREVANTATAIGVPPGGGTVTDEDSATIAVDPNPSITLTKSLQSNADEDGNGVISAGDTLTYSFVTTNDGSSTLNNVTITDPLPGLSALSCSPAQPSTLNPGESMSCTATYTVTQSNVDVGQIDNTAAVTGDVAGGGTVMDTSSVTTPVPQTSSIALVKSLQSNADEDGSGDVSVGDTLTYSFVATNSGTVTLDGVTIADPLPGLSALSCSPAAGSSLAPGTSMTCTATYSVSQADVDAGEILNTATVDATDPGGNPVDDTDDETVPITQTPSIDLVKSLQSNADEDGSGDVSLNDTLTYSFVATNTGTVTLDNVTITDPLPGLSALTCSPVAGSSLAPGASMTCTATYSVTQADVDAGRIDNTATVAATDPDGGAVGDTDDETVLATQDVGIVIVKSLQANADEDASGTVSLNDTLTYSFVATNNGTVTLDNVTITDPLPGLSALVCTPAAGASLVPGASMTCTATYVVTQADVDAGQILNTATADATDPGGDPVDDTDDETVPVPQNPSILLDKSLLSNADEDGSGDVSLNDTLTYQFVATNDGDVTLDNVAVADPLSGLSALSCSPVAGSSLAPGASMTCTATYVVTQADVDAGEVLNTATASATDPDGDPVDDPDDETVPVPQAPSIILDKSLLSNADEDGSGSVTLGDTLTYQFVATNDGNVTLDNVTITDPLPGLSALTCAPAAGASLAPGASMTCNALYSVDQGDVDAGGVFNTATVDATDPNGDPVDDTDTESQPITQSASIGLVKSLQSNADEDGSGTVTLGDTLTYSFVATNDGNVTLDNVTITDPLPGLSALSCSPVAGASLAPGASMTCTATYVVTQADVDTGQIDNTATVAATDPSGNPVGDTDDESVVLPQGPSIDLVKSLQSNADEDGSGDISVDDTLTYSFVATNDGDVTLTNVTVTDPLPGMSALSCTPSAGSSLTPGAVMTCTATYTVTQADVDAGQIQNTATAEGTPPVGPNVTDDDSVLINPPQVASIDLVKSLQSNADEDGSGTVSVGDTLTYSFVATNDGNVTLDNVTVTDPLPGLSALSCTPASGSSLAPGTSMTCTATYSVTQADIDSGTITNTATASGDDPDGNPVDDSDMETVVPPQNPSIDLVKSLQSNADEDGSGTVTLGDTLTYSFVATNDGDVTLSLVTITDPLPGLSTLSCSPAAGSFLAPTESMTCTATYVVTQADVDAGQIDNTADVAGERPGGDPGDPGDDVTDSDSESVSVVQTPSVALVKSLQSNADEDGSGDVSLSDTLTYQFVATNDGTVTLDNVTITDPLPGLSALTCSPVAGSSLAPTESMTCTATYSVTQSDVDAGQILNTATVDATDPGGNPLDDSDDETVPIPQSPSVVLVKSLLSNADEDGSGDVSLSDTLTYQFVATNDGDVTLDNVTVTDPLPGLSALTCSPVAGSSLAPTESMTCTATYSVAQADVDAGQILNTATVNATDPGGNPLDDTDDETVPITQTPSVVLVKSLLSNADEDGSGNISLNDTLTYRFIATNDGTVTLDNVTVTDPLPGLSALSCSPVAGSSLAPTESMTCTATYVVTQSDVDAGQILNTATVNATDPGGNPVDDTDDATANVTQTASIALLKSLLSNADEDGSGDVSLNDTLTYQFVATNDGSVTLDNVTITDPLPGLSALSCSPVAGSSLAPTESMTCTATYAVTQSDVDAGQILNTATVNATDPGGNPVDDTDDETVPVTQTPSVVLVKSLQSNADGDGSGDVSLNDTLTYEFVATNDGNVTLDNVTVTDPLPGLSALTCSPVAGSSLAPTESMTCTATYVVAQADVDAGQILNTATVNATDPGGNPVDDTDDETVPITQTPSVVLVKSLLSNADGDGSGDVSLNDTLTYQFVATNDGNVTLDNVTITDPLPGLSALSCSPVAGSSLAPTESMTCTATYVVTQSDVDAGQILNTATVDATDPGGNPLDATDDETVPITQKPSVVLLKSLLSNADEDGSGTVSTGDTLTYSFVATNDGNVTLDNVTITDPLPGLSALSCSPVAGSSLAPTESMTCTASYVVTQADSDAGQILNTATVDATDPGGNPIDDTDDETVTVPQTPSIVLVKSLQSNADEDGSGDVSLNDTLTYSFVATNDGTVTLDNVTITDPLPGLSALTCSPVAGSSLAPTESMTCSATYVVVQADVDAGQILNTATVDATDPGGNPVDDTDDETVVVGVNPSIALVKSLQSNADEDGSGAVSVDDTLTYTFVATNDGTVTLDNVTITDPLPGLSALTCSPVAGSSLAPTESMTCTATYVVTQSDVDAGQILNTATVDATDPGGDPVDDTDDETTPVPQTPSIDLVKTLAANADEDGSGSITLGDTLTYSFVATNDGDVTLANVAITDPLPGLSSLTCSQVAGSTLAPAESMTCSASYVVTQADVDAGQILNTATVTSTDPDGDPVDDTDDNTAPVAQMPSIDLVKSATGFTDADGSGTVSLNDTINYEFVATNDGTVTLDNVTITDPLPGLSALSCSPVAGSSLAPTESMTCTATYVVTQSDVDAGGVLNTATVNATDPGGNPVDDTDDEAVPTPQDPAISIVKSLQSNADEDGSGDVSLNDTLTYSFVATNDGNVTLDNVTITDPLPGLSALSCSPVSGSSLAPGASMTCTATYSVTQADVDAGQILNTATVDATDPGGNPIDDTDDETVPITQTPSIVLVKSLQSNADEDGSGDVSLNDTLTYEFVATNDGTVTLDNVTITDPLPGLSALTCSPGSGSSLAPTESMTCTATYVVTQADVDAGQILNTATVDATDPGGNPIDDTDDETVPITQTPSIALVKSLQSNADEDGSGTVTAGDTLTYSFVATNDGTVTLDNVTITDPLPGLSVLACAPVTGSSLAPSATMTCTATYSVTQADVDSGQIVNTATVDATDPGGNPIDDTDDETVTITPDPAIALVKSLQSNADEDGSGTVSTGDTLTYEFVATNDGNVTLDNVTVTDPLPGLSALSCSPAAGSSLVPTESMTCTATYVVTQGDVDAGEILNTATVDATDPGGNPVDDTDDETVPVPQTPSIALIKGLLSNADEDGSGDVSLNDTLTYSFVATNDGNVTLDNVTISDPLPGLSGLSCTPTAGATLAPSGSMSCTATYVVTQTDVDAGEILNTATVDATDPDGNPVDDTDDETVVVGADPSIVLVKSLQSNADEDGSSSVSLNDTLTYEFVATNDGTVTLDNVTITDPLPGLAALTCAPGAGASLTPGASMTCTATYVVTQADVDAGEILNTATVDATDPGGNPVDDTDDETVPVPQAPSIALVKSIASNADEDASGDVSVGDTLTYEFVATNDGDVTLDNVTITDPLPGLSALSCTPNAGASLAPSATMTCTATYVVAQSDANTGQIDNTATVSATDPAGNPVDDTAVASTPVAQNPVIGLAKRVESVVNNGDGTYRVTFHLQAENLGDVTLTDLVLTDDILTQFAGLSPSGFVASDGTLTASGSWDGSATSNVLAAGQSLDAGESGDVLISFTVTPGNITEADNNADISGTPPGGGTVTDTSTAGVNPDPNDDDDPDEDDPTVVSFVETPVIGLAKQVTAGPTANGDGSYDLTYELLVTNMGDTPLADLQITDDLSVTFGGVSSFGVSAVTSPALAVNPGYDGFSDVDLLAGTDTLAIGGSATLTIDLTVTPGSNLGPYENTAVAEGTSPGGVVVVDDSQDGADVDPDGNGDPGDNDDPTPVTFPSQDFDLEISKTGPGEVNSGDTATWSLVVTNLGPGVAPGPIVVTDTLPAQLSFVSAAGSSWSCGAAGQTVTCTRAADLAVGESASISLATIATGVDGERITNPAEVESQGPIVEVIIDNNSDEATLVIGVLPVTGSNLDTFAWYGIIMLLLGGLAIIVAQRRADQLWIHHGVR